MSEGDGRIYYFVSVVKVVDGDTLDLAIDVGFGVTVTHRFRLLGVDAPEVRGPSRQAGLESKRQLTVLVKDGIKSAISHKVDKFGRYIVVLFDADSRNINRTLVEGGFAEPLEEPWAYAPKS